MLCAIALAFHRPPLQQLSNFVVEDDGIGFLRCDRPLDKRPYTLMTRGCNPLLSLFLAFELELETIVVVHRHGSLNDRPTLEHLHADVAFMLHGLWNEAVMKRIQH